MKKRIPIACTLEPGDEMQSAIDRYRELFRAALVDSARTPGGVRWTLRPGDGVEDRVRALAAMEERCCAFLDMSITVTEDTIVWDVTGPEDASGFFEEYVRLAEV